MVIIIIVLLASPVEVRRRSGDMVEYARPSSAGEEEIQLQLALAMSKEEHDEELKKQKSDDVKLALALEESRKTQDDVSLKMSQIHEFCSSFHKNVFTKLDPKCY